MLLAFAPCALTIGRESNVLEVKQTVGAVGLLIVLFCFFFGLGFLVGRRSVEIHGQTPAVPVGERVNLRIAGYQP